VPQFPEQPDPQTRKE